MGSVNLTTVDKLYKHLYPDGVEVTVYDDCEFFGWLKKEDSFEGEDEFLTVRYSGTRGAGDYTQSLNAKGAPNYVRFAITRGEDYHHISINNQAIAASRSKRGALREAMKEAVDAAAYGVSRSMANQLWGTGTASRGTVATSGISGSTITLANLKDITRFEVDDVIELSASDDYSARRTGDLTVTNVDRTNGKLTFSVAVATGIPGAAAADYIFRQGESNPFMGAFGWIPKADVTVTSTAHFGVDRTVDIDRLAGSRLDGGGANMEDVIYEAVAMNHSNGGRARTLWLNTFDFARFQKEAASQTWIDVKTDNPKFGLKAIGFNTSKGPVAVMSDKDCPFGHALLTARESWVFKHLRGLPHLADEDGRKFRMESGADNITGWYRCWGNLFCKRPVDSTSIKW